MRAPYYYYYYTYSTRILCAYAKRRVSCRKSVTFLKYYENMLMRLLRGRQTGYIYAIYRVYIEIMTLRPRGDTTCALQRHMRSYIHISLTLLLLYLYYFRLDVCILL